MAPTGLPTRGELGVYRGMHRSWWTVEASQRLKRFQAAEPGRHRAGQHTGTDDTGTIPVLPAAVLEAGGSLPRPVLRVIRGGLSGAIPSLGCFLLRIMGSPATVAAVATLAAVPPAVRNWQEAMSPTPPAAIAVVHHRHRRYKPDPLDDLLVPAAFPGGHHHRRHHVRHAAARYTPPPSPQPSPTNMYTPSPASSPTPTPTDTSSPTPAATGS